jgi:two-component system sensor histidine kinase BaeS
MIPRSVRWRLPLSYAAIALLAALVLGGVLLAVLQDYYDRFEVDYLRRQVLAISESVEQTLAQTDVPTTALEAQVDGFSLLSQSRVRVLDADRRLLADSGPFDAYAGRVAPSWQMPTFQLIVRAQDPEQALPRLPHPPSASPFSPTLFVSSGTLSTPLATVEVAGGRTTVPFPPRELTLPLTRLTIEGTDPFTRGLPLLPPSSDDMMLLVDLQDDSMVFFNQEVIIRRRVVSETNASTPADYTIWSDSRADGDSGGSRRGAFAVGEYLGFDLSVEEASMSDQRSDHVVRRSIGDAAGDPWGIVELSEGPAYGREIVGRVARGWVLASLVAVLLAAGVGWVVSRRISAPLVNLTDVTAQMAAGNLSARADVARQDEFGALAGSFNRMADRVEDTVVALRRFVSDAAHEIHTPLTALRTNLELAPDVEFVRRAQLQVERLEALTQGLLDLSTIEAEVREATEERAPVALAPLVREMSELYASRAEQAGLTFDLVLPETEVTVWGDEAQLRRALGNLLDNGIKFTPEGGSICVGLRREGEWAELWVEDTGIGVPEQDLPYLFGRFHRGRNVAAYPGNGLGLAIVKAIVEGHGGRVTGENVEPGTRFTVRLPRRL